MGMSEADNEDLYAREPSPFTAMLSVTVPSTVNLSVPLFVPLARLTDEIPPPCTEMFPLPRSELLLTVLSEMDVHFDPFK